mmetsp:Transcript_114866/g.181309  ORF Transcript_114866/g.181309 Transcript_114866/m.181309 type:complete len:203 (+) Transcript_114866:492-1100(+)
MNCGVNLISKSFVARISLYAFASSSSYTFKTKSGFSHIASSIFLQSLRRLSSWPAATMLICLSHWKASRSVLLSSSNLVSTESLDTLLSDGLAEPFLPTTNMTKLPGSEAKCFSRNEQDAPENLVLSGPGSVRNCIEAKSFGLLMPSDSSSDATSPWQGSTAFSFSSMSVEAKAIELDARSFSSSVACVKAGKDATKSPSLY